MHDLDRVVKRAVVWSAGQVAAASGGGLPPTAVSPAGSRTSTYLRTWRPPSAGGSESRGVAPLSSCVLNKINSWSRACFLPPGPRCTGPEPTRPTGFTTPQAAHYVLGPTAMGFVLPWALWANLARFPVLISMP